MNPILLGALVGGGLGILKGGQDKKNFREEQKLNAIKALYSPWTGIGPTDVQRPSMMGSIMQGGLTGGAMGQQIANLPSDDSLDFTPIPNTAPTLQNAALDMHGGPTVGASNALNAQGLMAPIQHQAAAAGMSPWEYMTMQRQLGAPVY